FSSLTEKLSSCSISDDETRATIRRVYQEYDYLLDPHGAVGFLALERYLQAHPDSQGILLETAHPVKFYDVVEPLIGEKVPLPNAVKEIMQLPKKSTLMPANYDALKEFLFSYSA
ncbi:MAG TPA: threonine synthase, partial [Chitinophagaceae bacterium]|nr:threonine synthase [Chitinophagaceae bacterium]